MTRRRNEVFVCGGEGPLIVEGQDCPRRDLHTPCPAGYIAWFDWCGRQAAKGRTQKRCPGCGLYRVWTPGRR